MLINLKTQALRQDFQTLSAEIDQRLPAKLRAPCSVKCHFGVKSFDNYYLLTLKVEAILNLICQRCLDEYNYHYKNESQLAVCQSEEVAEKLMSQYESIVSTNNQVDLIEILTDELHLYAPEFHFNLEDCNKEASCFIHLEQE